MGYWPRVFPLQKDSVIVRYDAHILADETGTCDLN